MAINFNPENLHDTGDLQGLVVQLRAYLNAIAADILALQVAVTGEQNPAPLTVPPVLSDPG